MSRLPKAPYERQTVWTGNRPIDKHNIPRTVLKLVPGILPVRRPLHRVALLPEATHDEVGDLFLVLDHQDANTHS